MYAAIWLVAFLLSCQRFFSVKSDIFHEGPSPTAQLRKDSKAPSSVKRMVPKVAVEVQPFVTSNAYVAGSQKDRRHIRSENEPTWDVEELGEFEVYEPIFVKSNAYATGSRKKRRHVRSEKESEIFEPMFVKSSAYATGSRKKRRHIRSENEPIWEVEELGEYEIYEPLFVKSNAYVTGFRK